MNRHSRGSSSGIGSALATAFGIGALVAASGPSGDREAREAYCELRGPDARPAAGRAGARALRLA